MLLLLQDGTATTAIIFGSHFAVLNGSTFFLTDSHTLTHFWATVCKKVRPMLWDRCSVLSVSNVGVLWPNGWMDQDENWHGGRPRAWP